MCCKHVPQFVCILRHISLHIYRYNLNVNDCNGHSRMNQTQKHTQNAKHQTIIKVQLNFPTDKMGQVRKRMGENHNQKCGRSYKLRQNNLSCVSAKIHNKTNFFSLLCDIDNFFFAQQTQRKKFVVEMRISIFSRRTPAEKKSWWAKTKAKKKCRWNAVIKYQTAVSTLIKLLTFFGLSIVPRVWNFAVCIDHW